MVNAELAWVNGPLSLQSEFMWANVNVIGGPNQDHYGAYVYGSYFLTGEHRPYNRFYGRFERIKPLENFWMVNTGEGRCVGRGAWEATARWSYLDLTDGPDAEQMHDLTVGVNWYWNPHTRYMLNWIHPFTNTPAQNEEADILAMRLPSRLLRSLVPQIHIPRSHFHENRSMFDPGASRGRPTEPGELPRGAGPAAARAAVAKAAKSAPKAAASFNVTASVTNSVSRSGATKKVTTTCWECVCKKVCLAGKSCGCQGYVRQVPRRQTSGPQNDHPRGANRPMRGGRLPPGAVVDTTSGSNAPFPPSAGPSVRRETSNDRFTLDVVPQRRSIFSAKPSSSAKLVEKTASWVPAWLRR